MVNAEMEANQASRDFENNQFWFLSLAKNAQFFPPETDSCPSLWALPARSKIR